MAAAANWHLCMNALLPVLGSAQHIQPSLDKACACLLTQQQHDNFACCVPGTSVIVAV